MFGLIMSCIVLLIVGAMSVMTIVDCGWNSYATAVLAVIFVINLLCCFLTWVEYDESK